MNDETSDRLQDRYEQFQTFQYETQARASAISCLRPSELQAVQRIGRLYAHFRTSCDLDHQEVSRRTGLELCALRLLEHGFLLPVELTRDFLERVGSAFASDCDQFSHQRGGVFASIAGSMLEDGMWVGSEEANAVVDRLIEYLQPHHNRAEREDAVWQLAEHVLDPRARDCLVSALTNDRFPPVRMAALESLAAVSDDQAVRSILLGRLADPDREVRIRAAEIVTDSIAVTQPGLARAISRLVATTEQTSEAMLDRLRKDMALAQTLCTEVQLRPRIKRAESEPVISPGVESVPHNAELLMIGDFPDFGLALEITFEDAPSWAGRRVRVQFASGVEDDLSSSGWRVAWVGFGPDVVDSRTPVSPFGRIEVLLGRASLPALVRQGDPKRGSLGALVAIIGRALAHEGAISRLETVDQGR